VKANRCLSIHVGVRGGEVTSPQGELRLTSGNG
jgi:hypothetical protein